MLEKHVFEQLSLKGKTSIVTGGGQGLGREIAIGLAEAGSNVVIAARRTETAMKTKTEIEGRGVSCTVIQCDISDPAQVDKMTKQCKEEYGTIDVLVNNAGIWKGDDAEKFPLEDWNEVINVNLTSQFIVSQSVGKVMLEQGSGSIIMVSSMSGMIVNTPQNQCAYNASKGGLIMLAKSLACEWAERGVRVNALCPGYMRTEMSEDRYRKKDPAIERWFSMTPMARSGYASELKGIAVFLASEAASFVTGSCYVVDGGYTAW